MEAYDIILLALRYINSWTAAEFIRLLGPRHYTFAQMVEMISHLSGDSGRAECLAVLSEWHPPSEISQIITMLRLFDLDSARQTALICYLTTEPHLFSCASLADVLTLFTGNYIRQGVLEQCMDALTAAWSELSDRDALVILSLFDGDEAKENALQYMASRCIMTNASRVYASLKRGIIYRSEVPGEPPLPLVSTGDAERDLTCNYLLCGRHAVAMPLQYDTVRFTTERILVDGELYFEDERADEGYWPERQVSRIREQFARLREANEMRIAILESQLVAQREPSPVAARDQCVVCLERPKSVLLDTCNHLCLCSECAIECANERGIDCPLCRTVNAQWKKVYL